MGMTIAHSAVLYSVFSPQEGQLEENITVSWILTGVRQVCFSQYVVKDKDIAYER